MSGGVPYKREERGVRDERGFPYKREERGVRNERGFPSFPRAPRHSRESGNPEGICQNQDWRDLRDFDSPFATVIPAKAGIQRGFVRIRIYRIGGIYRILIRLDSTSRHNRNLANTNADEVLAT